MNLETTHHDHCRQTTAQVPSNVTVEGPNTRIVGLELDGDMPWRCGYQLRVSARWVFFIGDRAVPHARSSTQDVIVVAMHVERVREGRFVGKIQYDTGVPVEVVHLSLIHI